MYTVLVNVSYDDKGYIYLIKNTEGKKKIKTVHNITMDCFYLNAF